MDEDVHATEAPLPPAVGEMETQAQAWHVAEPQMNHPLEVEEKEDDEVVNKVRALVDSTMEENADSLHWKMKQWKQYVGEHIDADLLGSLTKATWSDIVTGVAMTHLLSQDMTQESQWGTQESQEDPGQSLSQSQSLGESQSLGQSQSQQLPTGPGLEGAEVLTATATETATATADDAAHAVADADETAEPTMTIDDDLFGDDSDGDDDAELMRAAAGAGDMDMDVDDLSVAEIDDLVRASQVSNASPAQSSRAHKAGGGVETTTNVALESELEAIKQIEKGPSEAELRRRKLIEVDEEELAFRIDRLNAVAMRELKKVAGRSRRLQQQQMKELKAWLRSHLGKGEDDIIDLIEEELGRCETRLRDSDGNTVDAMSYIRRPADQDPDDSESEDDEDADSAEEGKGRSPRSRGGANKEVLVLSDSEDDGDDDDGDDDDGDGGGDGDAADDEDGEVEVKEEHADASDDPHIHGVVLPGPSRSLQQLASSLGSKLNARAALKQQLRKKVTVTATENYCKQQHIQAAQLKLRIEVTEKCRQLVDLMRERQDRQQQRDALKRREFLSSKADADEEEFDEGAMDEQTAHMTAEEKEAFLANFRASAEYDEEEEEEEDYEEEPSDDVDDEEEEEGSNADENGDENDEGAGEEKAEAADGVPPELSADPATAVEDGGDDDDAVVRVRGGPRLQRNKVRFGDDVPSAAGASSSSSAVDDLVDEDDGEGATAVRQRLKPQRKATADEDGSGSAGEGTESAADDARDSSASGAEADEGPAEARGGSPGTTAAPAAKAKDPRSKNAAYRRMLLEEERANSKKKGSALLEEEADEEEEEGLQAGLGDFGFGTTASVRDREDEAAALKLRKDDLDHIVDDVSDDEGDEEAGLRARLEQGALDDRAQTKAIITAVTMGHEAVRRAKKGSKYAFDKLVGGRDEEEIRGGAHRRGGADGEGDDEAGEDAEDEEELLQRGLIDRANVQRQFDRKRRRFGPGDGSGSESEADGMDDSDVDDDEEDDAAMLHLAENDPAAAEELRKARAEERRRLREQQEAAAVLRKQFEQRVKINRARRRALHQQASAASQDASSQAASGGGDRFSSLEPFSSAHESLLPPAPMALSLDIDPFDPAGFKALDSTRSAASADSGAFFDSSSQMLADVTNAQQRPNSSAVAGGAVIKRARTVMKQTGATGAANMTVPPSVKGASMMHRAMSMNAGKGASGKFTGTLNQEELRAGYGMGMAVAKKHITPVGTVAPGGGGSEFGGSGLFSAVTGLKRSASDSLQGSSGAMAVGAARRSFAAASKRRTQSSSVASVASHQFVFMGGGGGGDDTQPANSVLGADGGTFSRSGTSNAGSSSSSSSATGAVGGGEKSLFAKLSARSGTSTLKRSHTVATAR